MTDLDKLKAKIRALRDKTVSSGCTEAEALAAAEAAARLMAEIGLSDADVDMTSERAAEKTTRSVWRSHICGSVMRATNTAAVLVVGDRQVEFTGGGVTLAHGVAGSDGRPLAIEGPGK